MKETRPLRAYAEVDLGRQRSPSHAEGEHMVSYLRAANVKDGYLDLSDVKEMNFTPREQRRFALRPGDVLVTEGSGSLSAVGATAVWRGELSGTVCFQNTLLRLRPRPGVDGRFLAWWCRYAFDDDLFASIATGANIFHLAADRVRAISLTYVTLNRQRAIAGFLDTEAARIDALIAKKQRLIRGLKERQFAALSEVVTGRAASLPLLDTGLEWLGAIPEHWRVERLKFIARMESGHTPSKTRLELWQAPSLPWITLNDVGRIRDVEFLDETENLISEAGLAASSARVLPPGTVVLSRDATIGRTAIMAEPMATSQHFANWICGDRLRARYLWLVFETIMQSHFDSLTAGSTLRTIGMPHLDNFVVPVPPVPEQDAIIARAETLRHQGLKLADGLDRQIDLLREHRQALITAAVTGELKVAGVAA